MMLDNGEKNKAKWKKKEKHLRRLIIWIVLAIVLLIVIIVFFRKQIWAIITNAAIIVGLVVNLIALVNSTKGDR